MTTKPLYDMDLLDFNLLCRVNDVENTSLTRVRHVNSTHVAELQYPDERYPDERYPDERYPDAMQHVLVHMEWFVLYPFIVHIGICREYRTLLVCWYR